MKIISMKSRISNPMPFLFVALLFVTSYNKSDVTTEKLALKNHAVTEVVSTHRLDAAKSQLLLPLTTNDLPQPRAQIIKTRRSL